MWFWRETTLILQKIDLVLIADWGTHKNLKFSSIITIPKSFSNLMLNLVLIHKQIIVSPSVFMFHSNNLGSIDLLWRSSRITRIKLQVWWENNTRSACRIVSVYWVFFILFFKESGKRIWKYLWLKFLKDFIWKPFRRKGQNLKMNDVFDFLFKFIVLLEWTMGSDQFILVSIADLRTFGNGFG